MQNKCKIIASILGPRRSGDTSTQRSAKRGTNTSRSKRQRRKNTPHGRQRHKHKATARPAAKRRRTTSTNHGTAKPEARRTRRTNPGGHTQDTRPQGPRQTNRQARTNTRNQHNDTSLLYYIYYTTGKPDVKRKQAKKYIFLLRTPNTETTQNDTQCSRETSPTTPRPTHPPPLFPSLKTQYSVGPQCEQHPEWTDLSSRVSNSKGRFILQKLNSPFPLSFCKINTLLLPYSCLTNPGMEGIIPPWAGGIRQVSTGLSY